MYANLTFKDERDGTIYPIIKIGKMYWFQKDFNLKTENSKETSFGRLYNYTEAINFAPNGWSLPDSYDLQELFKSTLDLGDAPLGHLGSGKSTLRNITRDGLNLNFGGYADENIVRCFGRYGQYWCNGRKICYLSDSVYYLNLASYIGCSVRYVNPNFEI